MDKKLVIPVGICAIWAIPLVLCKLLFDFSWYIVLIVTLLLFIFGVVVESLLIVGGQNGN